MPKKAEPEIPDTPHLNAELAYEGDGNDPYPEFEDELFQSWKAMGWLPKDLDGEDAGKYEQWLENNPTEWHPDKPDMGSVTPATGTK